MICAATSSSAVYADYQASTPVDPRVAELLAQHFAAQTANPHAGEHQFGWDAAARLNDARHRLAYLLNCEPHEVIFTSGATEANNLIIQGLAHLAPPSRRRIIVSAMEHKSVLAAARSAARFGCVTEILPVDGRGLSDPDELEARLADDVLLVSVMAVNNEVGSIQPVAAIGALCEANGCWFHTDAAQAQACGPIDVAAWRAHAISLSAHKIYGPQGIGALYVRHDLQTCIQPVLVGGGQQNDLRSGTVPVALSCSLADAAELMNGPAAESERLRIARMRDKFAQAVLELEGVALNGPPLSARHPGNCNLRFEGLNAHDILQMLQPQVAASTGSACLTGIAEPSHVLIAIGCNADQAESSIRFSFGRCTTEDEIDRLIELLSKTVLCMRQAFVA